MSTTDAAPFQCPYAPRGRTRCPEWRCDCFIDTYPNDPFGLHPEAFVVGRINQSETTHLCPPGDSALMPCCNRTPFEVPRTDRMTEDRSLVTCHALSPEENR